MNYPKFQYLKKRIDGDHKTEIVLNEFVLKSFVIIILSNS